MIRGNVPFPPGSSNLLTHKAKEIFFISPLKLALSLTLIRDYLNSMALPNGLSLLATRLAFPLSNFP